MYLYIKNLLIEICGGKLTTSIVSKDPISDITRPVIMRQKQTDKFGSVQCNEREISLGNPTEQIGMNGKKRCTEEGDGETDKKGGDHECCSNDDRIYMRLELG